MKYIMDILLSIDLLMVISTFISAKYYVKYSNKMNAMSMQNGTNDKVFVLLPAFKEQILVSETLDYFSKMDTPNCKIIVITSEQEEHENKCRGKKIKTTKECVEEYLNKNSESNIVHLHGNYVNGTKSTQLNFALEKIKELLPENAYCTSYVGVYDFDSRPNLDVLGDLQKIAYHQKYPEIVQQVPINLKNFTSLTRNKNHIMMLHCCQSMIRSVGIELASLILHAKGLFVPLYCMGAGMYIRLDALLENGAFPEPVDDLTLGYRLYLKGKRFALLPKYNSVEIPNSVKELVKQDTGIFKGVCSGLLELKQKSKLVRKIPTYFIVWHNILLRTAIPWMYLLYVCINLLLMNINLEIILILILPLLRTIAGAYSLAKADQNISRLLISKEGVRVFIDSYSWRLLRTVGPLNVMFSNYRLHRMKEFKNKSY